MSLGYLVYDLSEGMYKLFKDEFCVNNCDGRYIALNGPMNVWGEAENAPVRHGFTIRANTPESTLLLVREDEQRNFHNWMIHGVHLYTPPMWKVYF